MARFLLVPVLDYKTCRTVQRNVVASLLIPTERQTLLLHLPIWRTVIFRADLLRSYDFIGSEHRRESTTRNIPELGISCNFIR